MRAALSSAPSRRWIASLATLAIVLLGVVSGCSESNKGRNGDNDQSANVRPSAVAPTCQRNEPGCPCSAEGKRIACGKVTGKDAAGKVTCGTGGQVCSAGKWSECEIGAYAPGHDGVTPQALGAVGACNDACDLYCKAVQDTPDPTVNLSDGGGLSPSGGGSGGNGVILVDGGISLTQSNRSPDGGLTEEDLAILRDAGAIDAGPDAPALIFHELLPGETAQDPVVLVPGEIPSTDIYFMLDDTASMYDESAALTSAIQASPSMITRIRALFNDDANKVQFGFGRFEEFKGGKYVTDTTANSAFEHILSISADPIAAGVAAKWVREDSYGASGAAVNHTGGTFPESTVPALWLLATGGNDPAVGWGAARGTFALSSGNPICNPASWWVMPRACWGGTPIASSYFTTNSATPPAAEYPASAGLPVPCPAVANPPPGYNPGYPCWRPNKTPIVIVMTDAPAHNGPGGQYGYMQTSSTYGLQGAGLFPNATAAPAAAGPVDGSSFANAITLPLPAMGSGAVYYGTVPSRSTPNGISASWAGGGVTRTEQTVDNAGNTYVTRELVPAYPSAASMTVGREYRSTMRDCSTTSVNVCNPGTTNFPETNAQSSQPQTTDTIAANVQALVTASTPTSVPSSTAYYASVAGTWANPDTCTLDTTSASSANAAYVSGGVTTILNDTNLPTTLVQAGNSGTLNIGDRVRFTLTLVSPGQDAIQARLHVKLGSAPGTGDPASGSITNTTTSATIDRYATANGQTIYVAVERQQGTPSFPRVMVTREVFTAQACAANTVTINPPNDTTARVCWTCKTASGYSYTATCGAGTARAGQPGCFKDNPPTCSGGSPATVLCGGVTGSPATVVAGNTTCCQAKTCPAGWVLNAAQTTCVQCPAAYPIANANPPTLCAQACPAATPNWDGTTSATNCNANCSDGTWTPDFPRDRCLKCPTATPAYSISNAATATCSRNTCPAGWSGPSGGNCTQNSCVYSNACSANYTCVGAVGAAKCKPSCNLCGTSTCTPTGTSPNYTNVACTNPCASTGNASRADGYRSGEMIYKFTVPVKDASKPNHHPANWHFYHFALLKEAPGAPSSYATDLGAFLYIKPATAGDPDVASDGSPGSNVLDCNRDANKWNVINNTADANRYKRSELNSYLLPGDYYLVIDNLGSSAASAAATSTAYNYILQIGGFDDSNPLAGPSYRQAVNALNAIGAKTIGIDSSGTSCQQAGLSSNNAAGTETREFLEQLGRDTNAVDGITGKPFVVPIRQNAGDCSGASGTNGLQDAVEDAVEALTRTLRQDITLRAVFANQPVTSPVFAPPVAPAQFIQSVVAVDSPDVQANCGSTPTLTAIANEPVGTVPYGSQKFQVCLPGTGVVFQVTFVMPASIPRLTYDQYFRFDLVILRGVGEVSRVPVVLKLPKLPAPGDFYRDYDMTDACPAGTRIIWDRLAWNTDDPLTDPSNASRVGSKIDISLVMGTSLADLVAKTGTPSEVALATAKASPWPSNTEVGSAQIGPVTSYRRDTFLRVHFRLVPSPQGAYPNNAVYVPTLRDWQLYISCPPSE